MGTQPAGQVADAFITALESADSDAVAALLHPDIQVSYNFMSSVGKEQFVTMQRMVDRVAARKLKIIERHVIGNRVIQRHQLSLVPRTGEASLIDVALFVTVEQGMVIEMKEYLDSAQLNQDILSEALPSTE